MGAKKYEKPNLVAMPSQWARWCKWAVVADQRVLNLPWGKIHHRQTIRKGLFMEAPVEEVWNAITDWSKADTNTWDVKESQKKEENLYAVTVRTFNRNEGWQETNWNCKVIEAEPPYRIKQEFWSDEPRPLGNFRGTVEWLLEKAKGGTMVWLTHEYDAKMADTEAEEEAQERLLGTIYREVVGDKKFSKTLQKFKSKLPDSLLEVGK